MATLDDIARLAGVTPMTVSNVLNGRTRATRGAARERAQRIRAIAAELNYRPNAAARSMARGRFNAVGLVVPISTGGYFPPGLLRGLIRRCGQHDVQLVLAELPDTKMTDAGYVPKILRELSVDGLMLNYIDHTPPGMIELIRRSDIPAIALNSKQPVDCIHPDDYAAGEALGRKLAELGHRRVGFVALEARKHYSAYDRPEGLAAGMGREVCLFEPASDADGRGEVVRQLLATLERPDRPTAFVCYDAAAVQALVPLLERYGLVPGRDVAVAGFGGRQHYAGDHVIDTMQIDEQAFGEAAATMLLKRIDNEGKPLKPRLMPLTYQEGRTLCPAE